MTTNPNEIEAALDHGRMCLNTIGETKNVQIGRVHLETLIAAASARGVADGWRDIGNAPYDTPVVVRVGDMTFKARLLKDASMTDLETPCDQWAAEIEGEHPPCWSGGACWESNEDEVQSLQPSAWRSPAAPSSPAATPEVEDDGLRASATVYLNAEKDLAPFRQGDPGKHVRTLVPTPEWKALSKACQKRGLSISLMVRIAIRSHLAWLDSYSDEAREAALRTPPASAGEGIDLECLATGCKAMQLTGLQEAIDALPVGNQFTTGFIAGRDAAARILDQLAAEEDEAIASMDYSDAKDRARCAIVAKELRRAAKKVRKIEPGEG